MTSVLYFALALLGVNLWALTLFALDKRRARQGEWRISEAKFLILAACGGWPALKLGQRLFRHKTRKQPFGFLLNMMIAVNLLLASMGGYLSSPQMQAHLSAWGPDGLYTSPTPPRQTPRFFQPARE